MGAGDEDGAEGAGEEPFRERHSEAPHQDPGLALAQLDSRALIVHSNDQFLAMAERPYAAVVGTPFLELLDPGDRRLVQNDMTTVLASAEVSPARVVRMDGIDGWRRLTLMRALDGGLIVGLEDLSAARRAEEQARLLESAWIDTIRASPIAVVVAKVPAGPIIEVNEAFEQLRGIPRDELVGQSQVSPHCSSTSATRTQ